MHFLKNLNIVLLTCWLIDLFNVKSAHFGRNKELSFVRFMYCLKRKFVKYHCEVHEGHNGVFFLNSTAF